MNGFLLLFAITFSTIVAAGLVINFCRRRASRTNHGLTGMCHKSGGSMCSCCGASFLAATPREKGERDRCRD